MRKQINIPRLIQNILTAALLVASLYLLAINLDFQLLVEKSGEIQPWPVLILVLLTLFISYLKGSRIADLTKVPITNGQMTNISIVHSYLASMLPFKLGEFALPALLKRFAKYSMARAFGKLVFIRIIDLSVVLIVGVLLALLVSGLAYMKAVSMVMLVGILLFLALIKSDLALEILKKIPGVRKAKGILEAINEITHREYIYTLLITSFIWFMTYVSAYYTFKAVGLEIPFTAMVVATTLVILSAAIPIQTPGMIGTYEGLTLFAFALFGTQGEGILELVLLSHILSIIINTVVAAVSAAILFIQSRELDRNNEKERGNL